MRNEKLRKYEGLVFSTARMYEGVLRVEREDLQQVLRLRVWRALESYDSRKSATSEESFVFTCIRNQIKDLVKARVRRDALAREVYIEDMLSGEAGEDWNRSRFELRHGLIENSQDDEVLLPSTLSPDERQVIALLYVGYSQTEIAGLLTVPPRVVWAHVRLIREKMDEWRPSAVGRPEGAEIVQLASEALAVLSRAA